MKIAIPLDENKKDICVSFARSPYFLYHDIEKNITEIIDNPACDAEGGAGIKAAQFIIDNNADVVITIRCGENSAEILKEVEIEIYKSQLKNALDNIELYKKGKLIVLENFNKGFQGIQ